MSTSKPLGQRNYEQFASRYAKYALIKPHNAAYERPATLSLLPEVTGQRVLDAGCGPGIYTEELMARGAEVVGVDVTPEMVEQARGRVGTAATLHVADLEQPFAFARDAEFDGVVSPLMLDYLDDWGGVFSEFARVLKPGGWLVYSHAHPMSDYRLVRERVDPDSDYFARERFTFEWSGFGNPKPSVEGIRRPLADMLNPLADAGLQLDRLLEPLPSDAIQQRNPKLYAELREQPCFLCVRARKPG